MKHLCAILAISLLAFACASCGPTYSSGAVFKGDIPAKPVTAELLALSEADFSLPEGEHNCELIFCNTKYSETEIERSENALEYRPTILRHDADGWKVLDLDVYPFSLGNSWIDVFVADDTKMIWAIAQGTVEDPGPNLEIVFSKNGGRTWQHIASVEKPFYLAHFIMFRMDSRGRGSILFFTEDAPPEDMPNQYFECRTQDWGRSWTKPICLENTAIPLRYEEGPKQDLKKLLTNK